MQMRTFRLRTFAFAVTVLVIAFSGSASADPPSRVARVGFMAGAVSFSPAGEDDWVQAAINRPLTTGDRLWTDAGARAEVQLGSAMIRMNGGTGLSVLNLDDQIAQLQLTQGVLSVRVRRLDPDQAVEVDTPNLAFTLRQPGQYRIEVDPNDDATTIIVRSGQGEVYGEDASYVLDSRQPYRFTGTGLREYQVVDGSRLDDFDRWSSTRDRSYDNSASARYVSPDVVGYQDLDANGTWRSDPTYGNVWIPSRVGADWAPYRDGHWAWVDPWGWTWVDDAPWGFAVSHYGRWTNFNGTWGWVPGPLRTRAYYAPALVAFVGGNNFQLAISGGNVGGVAWFPLGPRDVYRPAYQVSRGYFENVNRSNTVINTTVINNYYNNTNVTNIVYANRQVPGAVVAMPTTAFVQSQPVGRAAVRLNREAVASAPVTVVPSVAPTERSVRGAAAPGDNPPPRTFDRRVIARTAPPAAHAGFAAQQQQLAAKPGQPLDESARKGLKRTATVSAPAVNVVAPAQKAPPSAAPPAVAPGARPADAREKSDQRGKADERAKGEQRGQAVEPPKGISPPSAAVPQAASPAPPKSTAPAPAVAPPATVTPPEQRGKADERAKGERRGQPPEPPKSPPPPPAVAPQAVPPAPAAPPPEQRGKADERAKGQGRGQPPEPPKGPPQAPAVAPQAAPSGPPAQPQSAPKAEPRGQEAKPAADKSNQKKKDADEQKREEEERKKKGG